MFFCGLFLLLVLSLALVGGGLVSMDAAFHGSYHDNVVFCLRALSLLCVSAAALVAGGHVGLLRPPYGGVVFCDAQRGFGLLQRSDSACLSPMVLNRLGEALSPHGWATDISDAVAFWVSSLQLPSLSVGIGQAAAVACCLLGWKELRCWFLSLLANVFIVC